MSTDLEDRLARYGRVLDASIAQDLAGRGEPASSPRRSIVWLVAAAVAIAGLLATIAILHDDSARMTTATEPSPPPPSPSSTVTVPPLTDEQSAPLWDPVPLVDGLVGWYDVDLERLPADLVSRLGARAEPPAAHTSASFRCTTWMGERRDGGLPECASINGAAAPITYGSDVLSVGTAMGPYTPEKVLWSSAQLVQLWGDQMPAGPPTPQTVAMGGVTLLSYRDADRAVTAWQLDEGTVVWLTSNGLSDEDLRTLAATVTPADLPARLPFLADLGGDGTDPLGLELPRTVGLGWLDGIPCVGVEMATECTPVTDAPVIVASDPDSGSAIVAGIAPAGSGLSLEVERYQAGVVAESNAHGYTVDLFGLDVLFYSDPNERVLSARLVDTDDAVVVSREFPLADMTIGFAPDLVAEGRTDSEAWVVLRQDPNWAGPVPQMSYGDPSRYCWILIPATGGFVPLCPTSVASGIQADDTTGGNHLGLFEVAPDVASVACGPDQLEILADDHFAGTRFVVSPCRNPVVATNG